MDAQTVIARRIALELRAGMLVNLGIGIPTLVANYVPAGMHIFFQSENGLIGTGDDVFAFARALAGSRYACTCVETFASGVFPPFEPPLALRKLVRMRRGLPPAAIALSVPPLMREKLNFCLGR